MTALDVADRVLVPFEGEGAGVGALSWGQQEMWGAIQRMGSSLALGGVSPLPAGLSVRTPAAALSFIMSRHPSLRTRIRVDAHGRAEQVVAAAGEIPLEVVDAGDADPAAVADAVRDRYHTVEFDYADEWPVRMAVVRHRGVLTHAVAMYCHVALDGEGLVALIADLSTMDPQTGRPTGPARGLPPLEQARWQAGPAGRRRNELTLRYWDRLLRSIPARRFGPPVGHSGARFQEAEVQSPAMDLAARLIAARLGLDTSPVLLAAFAVALARVTGVNPSVAQVVVSNRFRPGFADAVSTVSHPGLCVVDVAGGTFDEVVTRAWQASLAAYKNAYYDPLGRIELLDRIGRERGEEIDIACFFNDRRAPGRREGDGPPPTPEQIAAALPGTRLSWRDVPVDPASERFFLHVNDVPGAIDLRVSADTFHLPRAGLEAFVAELEAVTVAAALDPSSSTGI